MTNARSSKPANAPIAPPQPVNPAVAKLSDLYAPKPYWHHPLAESLRSRTEYNDEQKALAQSRLDEFAAELVAHEDEIRAAAQRQDYSLGVAHRNKSLKLDADIGFARTIINRLLRDRESIIRQQREVEEFERRANTVPVEA